MKVNWHLFLWQWLNKHESYTTLILVTRVISVQSVWELCSNKMTQSTCWIHREAPGHTWRSVTKGPLTSQQMLLQSRLQMWPQSQHFLLRQTDYWSPPCILQPLERLRISIKRSIDDLLICILLFTLPIRAFTSLLTNQLHIQHKASFLGHRLPFPI